MADDRISGPCILEHRRGDIARMGTGKAGMTILAAQMDGRCSFRHRHQQCGWRGNQDVQIGTPLRNRPDFIYESKRLPQTVHFPVASNKHASRHSASPAVNSACDSDPPDNDGVLAACKRRR
jgi:hypothetical protein